MNTKEFQKKISNTYLNDVHNVVLRRFDKKILQKCNVEKIGTNKYSFHLKKQKGINKKFVTLILALEKQTAEAYGWMKFMSQFNRRIIDL